MQEKSILGRVGGGLEYYKNVTAKTCLYILGIFQEKDYAEENVSFCENDGPIV